MKTLFTPFLCYFVIFTPLDGQCHCLLPEIRFFEYITSLHIQHLIYVRQVEFFGFTMKQIASIFCNVSFAGQYIIFGSVWNHNNKERLSKCDKSP